MDQATRVQTLIGYGYYNKGKLTRDQQADGLDLFVEGWKALDSGARRFAVEMNRRAQPLKTYLGQEILLVMARLTRDARVLMFEDLRQQRAGSAVPNDPLAELLRHEQAVGIRARQGVYDKEPADPDLANPDKALAREKNRVAQLLHESSRQRDELRAHPEMGLLGDLMERFPEQAERLMTDPTAYPAPTSWVGGRVETLRVICSSGPEGDFAKALRQARRQYPQFDATVKTVLAPKIRAYRELDITIKAARADVQRFERDVEANNALFACEIHPDRYVQVLADAFASHADVVARRARDIGMNTTAGNIVRTHANWTEARRNAAAATELVRAQRRIPQHNEYGWLRPPLQKQPLQELTPACFAAMGGWLQAGCNALRQMQVAVASGQTAHFERLPPHPYHEAASEACPIPIDTILHNAKLMENVMVRASPKFQVQTHA